MKKSKYGSDVSYTEGFNDGFDECHNLEFMKHVSLKRELTETISELRTYKSKLSTCIVGLQIAVGILVVLISCIAARGCSNSSKDEPKPNNIAAQYEHLMNPGEVSVVTKKKISYVANGNVMIRNVGTGSLLYDDDGWFCSNKFTGFNYHHITNELQITDGDQIDFYVHNSESGFVQFDFNDVTYNVVVKRGNSCANTLLLCWKSNGRKIRELPRYPYENAFIWASESFRDKSYFGTENLGTVDIDGQQVAVKMKVLKVDGNVRIEFMVEKNQSNT